MPSLSSSYNISGLVPACWLLFQCFVLKPAKLPKSLYIWTCPGVFLRDEQWKWTKTNMITCIYIMSRIVYSYFLWLWRYSDKQTNKLLFLLLPYEVYFRDIPDFGSRVALATWQTDRLVITYNILYPTEHSSQMNWYLHESSMKCTWIFDTAVIITETACLRSSLRLPWLNWHI